MILADKELTEGSTAIFFIFFCYLQLQILFLPFGAPKYRCAEGLEVARDYKVHTLAVTNIEVPGLAVA